MKMALEWHRNVDILIPLDGVLHHLQKNLWGKITQK